MGEKEFLQGQTALVTGAATGIGRASALALAAAGADIAINYLDQPDKARKVADQVRQKFGVRAQTMPADVSSEAEVERLFATTIEAFGHLDILISNAGIQQDASFVEMNLKQWQKVIDVNLTGAFLCARAAVRQFLS